MGFSTSCQKKQNEAPQPTTAAPAPTPTNPSECITKASANNGQEIQGQYIIKYKAMSTMATNSMPAFIKKAGISEKLFAKIYAGQFHAAVAKLNYEQLQAVKKDENVEAVEPDRVVSITSCATVQPAQTIPWGIDRVGGVGDGTGKTIWIIDTGVDLQHPDLNIDASRCVSFISGSTPNDDHGHGTHVAGTIAAKNNGFGVVGVAANATIVALKVMDASGSGSSSTVMQGVNYVAQHGKPGDVVNMSVGGDVSDVLDQAVRDAASKGILFAIAAGNEHTDASNSSPARVNATNVYTVSAINNQDEFASFSNYGASVDYAAPGVNITSTYKGQSYATMSGTSMATPHMAGLLLLKGKNIITDGFAKDDPDGHADPIAHK
jgi:subtilisin family serine protease